MRINKNFSVEYKNGYYIVNEHKTTGKESKKPGVDCIVKSQTYPTLLAAWEQSHIESKDKSKFLDCAATVRGERDKLENISYLKRKAALLKSKDI